MKWLREFLRSKPSPDSQAPAPTLATPDPFAAFTADDWSGVGLDIVYPLGLGTDNSFWGGTVERCDAVLARIGELRATYAQTQPVKMRHAIAKWLDHYARQARENREDIVTLRSLKAHQAYCAREALKEDHARRVRETLRKQGVSL